MSVGLTSSVMESREDVASSYRRMGGFFSMARAMATRCFSPPDTEGKKGQKKKQSGRNTERKCSDGAEATGVRLAKKRPLFN